PITISAKFCIEILFFDICWSGSFDLPPAALVALPLLPDLLDLLVRALSDSSSVSSSGTGSSSSALVSQPQPAEPGAVIPPYGQIAWVQRILPLDTELQRFNGQPLTTGPQAFQVTTPAGVATSEVRDHFAPGTFLDRTKAEQLNQATFER